MDINDWMEKMIQKLFINLDSGAEVQNDTVGGKAHSLLKLSSKFNVPKGFVITTFAFDEFLRSSGIAEIVKSDKATNLDFRVIREKFKNSKLPETLLRSIEKRLDENGLSEAPLVVRSSATIEDSSKASFAGRFKTVINVKGIHNIEAAVKDVYASTFTKDVLSYCEDTGKKIENVKMAVIIQELIIGDASGVIFTIDPNTFDEKTLIEAVVGLNDGLVSGKITPSNFIYDNKMRVIESSEYARQPHAITVKKNGTRISQNDKDIRNVLGARTLEEIGALGQEVEKVFGIPQDIEWTVSNGRIYVLQSRPITTHRSFYTQRVQVSNATDAFKGYAASRGVAKGKVALVNEPNKKIPTGAVLVAEVLDTNYSIETIKGAKAIITEDGGILSHAAILARELGIPCVVGVQNIMKKLKKGEYVVVDGSNGFVYKSKTLPAVLDTGSTLDYSFIYDFSKMSKLGSTEVYYEQFDHTVIYYVEKEVDSIELQRSLINKFGNNQIIHGSMPKYFIYKQYLLNNRDPEMNKLSLQAVKAAKSFSAAKIDAVANMLLTTAKQYIEKNTELPDKETAATKKIMLLNLMRAGWCYTLLNELICEGYAITTIDKKLHSIFRSDESAMLDFISAVDSGEEFSYEKLKPIEKAELKNARKFYTTVRRWRLDSYPMFEAIGATGDVYQSKVRGLIASLATQGEDSNEIKAGAIAFSNSLNQIG